MLLQTNSYIVPGERRVEHARLMRRFRQILARLGCDQFEVYELVSPNFAPFKGDVRFVQLMRFRDRRHQQAVQAAERVDSAAQDLIQEFCDLVNIEYQKDCSLLAVGYYALLLDLAEGAVPVGAEPDLSAESRDFVTVDLPRESRGQEGKSVKCAGESPSGADGSCT